MPKINMTIYWLFNTAKTEVLNMRIFVTSRQNNKTYLLFTVILITEISMCELKIISFSFLLSKHSL